MGYYGLVSMVSMLSMLGNVNIMYMGMGQDGSTNKWVVGHIPTVGLETRHLQDHQGCRVLTHSHVCMRYRYCIIKKVII